MVLSMPVKGRSNNPSGVSVREARLKRAIEGLSGKAIAALDRALTEGTISEQITAAKEVLDRNLGKPRQNSRVDVDVRHSADAHVAALAALTAKAKPILDLQAEAITLNSLDNPASLNKPALNYVTIDGLPPPSEDDES